LPADLVRGARGNTGERAIVEEGEKRKVSVSSSAAEKRSPSTACRLERRD